MFNEFGIDSSNEIPLLFSGKTSILKTKFTDKISKSLFK